MSQHEMQDQRRFTWTQRIMTAVSVIAMLVGFIAMTVAWLNAETERDAARIEVRTLQDTLERQVQGTGACDAHLAEACGGFWAFEWLDVVEGEPFEAKAEASVNRAQDEVQRGRLACKKSYPKGAGYQGGSR